MSWRRAALDERLEILKEQLGEQLSREDGGWLEWLEHQIRELMVVAVASDHGDYVGREASRVMAAISCRDDGGTAAIAAPSIALADPSMGC